MKEIGFYYSAAARCKIGANAALFHPALNNCCALCRRSGIKALVQDPQAEEANKDFFDDFFRDGGDYMRFVVLSNSGMADVIKYGKEYKVGLTVTVNTPALRKYLEQKGVIAALNKGFN